MYSKKLLFASACLGMLSFGIVFISLGSIAPDLKNSLSLSDIEAGTLFSILPVGVLLGSLIFGPLIDKSGYKILLVISCLLITTGFEGIAFSSSKGLIKVWIFLTGLGGGAINGATNALVADISEKNKGANLSILGVFYGIGALGTPLIIGLLREWYSFEKIFIFIGAFTFLLAVLFLLISFPPPKQSQGFPLKKIASLLKESVLWLLALFLFFQSAFEGIINNWTTLYLTENMAFHESLALYGLSLFVGGIIVVRLLLGSVFRNMSTVSIMTGSFILIFAGIIILKTGSSFNMAAGGLFIIGTGLGGGFPLALGLTAERFSSLSGTAFSFALVLALTGNTLINYSMGIIAENFGIKHLTSVALVVLTAMILLFTATSMKIKKKEKNK